MCGGYKYSSLKCTYETENKIVIQDIRIGHAKAERQFPFCPGGM
jgi:hypothetical protein